MAVVDSHVHVVASDVARFPLRPTGVGSRWYEQVPVDADAFVALMDGAGVDLAVLVQAFGPYGYDNAYVVDAAGRHADRCAAVCIVDVTAEPVPLLRRLLDRRGVAGVRLFPLGGAPLDDERADGVWELAAERGFTVSVALLAADLPQLAARLDRFPAVTVALDHCGFPDVSGGPPYPGAAPLLALADRPNLHLKATCHLLEQAADPRDLVDRLVAVFGPERVLWGSDFPQTHDRSFADLVALGRLACERLVDGHRALFLGGNAERLWFAGRR